jgi:hypothetical protein
MVVVAGDANSKVKMKALYDDYISMLCSLIHTIYSYCSITYLTTAFRGVGEDRIANTGVVEGNYPSPVLYLSSCLTSLHRTKRWLYSILIMQGCAAQ